MRKINFSSLKWKDIQYLKSIGTLVSAQTLAQAVPFLCIPILTRLYSSEDFGVFALVISIATLISVGASGKFELSLMICDGEREKNQLFALCLDLICVITALTLFTITILYFSNLSTIHFLLGHPVIFAIPALVFATAFYNVNFHMANTRQEVKKISASVFINSLTNNVTSLIFSAASSLGLIFGSLAGFISASSILLIRNNRIAGETLTFRIRNSVHLLKKYKKFPIFTVPSDVIDIYAKQLPLYFLSAFAMVAEAGFYFLTERILTKPISFLGSAVAVPFRSRATQEFKSEGSCRATLFKTVGLLALLSLPGFLVLYFWAPDFFSWLLGEDWVVTGEYVQVLVPMYFMQFVSSPVSYVLYIANKQEIDFYLHIVMAVVLSVIFYIGLSSYGIKATLHAYSAFYVLVYFVYFLFYWYYSVNRHHLASDEL